MCKLLMEFAGAEKSNWAISLNSALKKRHFKGRGTVIFSVFALGYRSVFKLAQIGQNGDSVESLFFPGCGEIVTTREQVSL